MNAVTELSPAVGVLTACEVLGVARRFLLSATTSATRRSNAGCRAGVAGTKASARPVPQPGGARQRAGRPP